MKFNGSYSECFYQVRNLLRARLASHFRWAKYCNQYKTLTLEMICDYADDLTAFNEVSGLPFFERFNRFECYDS